MRVRLLHSGRHTPPCLSAHAVVRFMLLPNLGSEKGALGNPEVVLTRIEKVPECQMWLAVPLW
eukprot:4173792-Alexandrium_andersonii.AAC.1